MQVDGTNAFKCGLTYEKLREAADADALTTLGNGGVRKNGAGYQAKTTYVDNRGEKPRRVTLSKQLSGTSNKPTNNGGTTKTELNRLVREWMDALREDIARVANMDNDPSMPVRDCLRRYIDSKCKQDADGNEIGIQLSTRTFYDKCAARIEKSPALASKSLVDVKRADVQGWVDHLAKTYAKKSISDALKLLSTCCDEYLGADTNPCKGVKIPKSTRNGSKLRAHSNRPNALNEGGVARLNSLLDEKERKSGTKPDMLVVAARIAMMTGMRAEEVCGLKWRNVDFINGYVHVDNVIQRAKVDGKFTTFDARPKSESSVRSIPMSDELRDVLVAHRERYVAMMDEGADIDECYVVGYKDGRHRNPNTLCQTFIDLTSRNNVIGSEGVRVSFHDLRHTFATISLRAHPEMLSEISHVLGHAKIEQTLDAYVGLDAASQKTFMKSVSTLFARRLPEDVVTLGNGTEGR